MPRHLTAEHKEALATGRAQSIAIRRYLDALLSQPDRRSRRTPEELGARLNTLEAEIRDAHPLKAVRLVQERLDLRDELQRMVDSNDAGFAELRSGFVQHARAYSDSKGLSYAAWREIGVPAEDLRAAGIPQTRRRS